MAGPITPEEVQDKKDATLPEEVFQVFNDFITKYWNGDSAIVYQEEVAKDIAKALNTTVGQVFARNLLDVEFVYRKAGWEVEYDKPAYCETYPAKFIFRK